MLHICICMYTLYDTCIDDKYDDDGYVHVHYMI